MNRRVGMLLLPLASTRPSGPPFRLRTFPRVRLNPPSSVAIHTTFLKSGSRRPSATPSLPTTLFLAGNHWPRDPKTGTRPEKSKNEIKNLFETDTRPPSSAAEFPWTTLVYVPVYGNRPALTTTNSTLHSAHFFSMIFRGARLIAPASLLCASAAISKCRPRRPPRERPADGRRVRDELFPAARNAKLHGNHPPSSTERRNFGWRPGPPPPYSLCAGRILARNTTQPTAQRTSGYANPGDFPPD